MPETFNLTMIIEELAHEEEKSSLRSTQPTEEHMQAVMRGYVENINHFDPNFVSINFSDDYTYEDPVGAGILGTEDLAKRFDPKFFTLKRAELISPVSTSFGNSAAMAFRIFAELEGHEFTLDIVDVMTFNDAGQIADVKAYWGRKNVKLVN